MSFGEEWKQLVRRYQPADRRLCNCRNAYYTWFPPESGRAFLDRRPIGAWLCANGCSANQIEARDHVAKSVLAELPREE